MSNNSISADVFSRYQSKKIKPGKYCFHVRVYCEYQVTTMVDGRPVCFTKPAQMELAFHGIEPVEVAIPLSTLLELYVGDYQRSRNDDFKVIAAAGVHVVGKSAAG